MWTARCAYLRRFLLGLRAAISVDCSVGLPSSFLVGFESCHQCGLLGGLTFVVSCWGLRAAMRVDCSVGLPLSFLVGFESCHQCGLLGGLTFVVSCWV